MDLKLNVQKQGLSTTAETINEEFTLHYGHIFRGEDAETLIIDYATAQTLYNSGGQSEEFKSIYSKLVSNPSMNVAIRFWDDSYIASSHITTSNAKYYIRVDCQYISKGFRLGGGEIWHLRAASVNITPEGGVSLLQSYDKELVDSSLIANDLTTSDETRVLSARQGAVLNETKVGFIEQDADTGDYVLYASKGIGRASNVEIGRIKSNSAISIRYSELRELKLAGRLIAGAFYRIIDYQTTTKQSNTRSAGHPFDIIVQALDKGTLSENAHAIQREGDTYFANSNLKAWSLKYALDGDTSRFAWAQTPARPQSWSCAWGVLESKENNDASSNYEQATIDGKSKYLYRPAEPTSHLQGKQFYRDVVISSITSPEGLIYEADSAPSQNEDYYDYPSEIRVKTASGEQVALFVQEYDNYYYDENDSGYYITFGSSYQEVDGVYQLTPESGVENWWEYVVGGSIEETEREYYNGAVDSLYYCFDSILPKSSKTVTEVTDKVHIYKTGGTIDTITYQSYISEEDGGKGVIYKLTDEFGNTCNYDFKNIQFKQGADWYYNFGATDNSISGTSFDNNIDFTNGTSIVPTIFKNVAKWNRFHAVVTTSATFEGKVQAVSIDTSSSGFTTILAKGDWFGGVIDGNTQGSLTTDKLTSFRIQNSGNSTFKGTFLTCSFFGRGSVSIGDANGNPKSLRGLRAYFGINDSNVKLVYNGTMSSTAGIKNIELVAPDWGTSEVTVNLDSYKEGVKIAKNSSGVVKVWNEADLA